MAISTARTRVLSPIAYPPVLALLLIMLMGFLSPAQADDALGAVSLPEAQTRLEQLQQQFADIQISTATTKKPEKLEKLKQEITIIRSTAVDCVRDTEPQIDTLNSELAVLQPQTANKTAASLTPGMKLQLEDLQNKKAALNERIANCKLLLLGSGNMDASIDDYLRTLQAHQLLTRGPTLLSLLQANLAAPERWLTLPNTLTVKGMRWDALGSDHVTAAAVVGLIGLIGGFILGSILRRRMRAQMAHMDLKKQGISASFVQALMTSVASYAPILLGLAGIVAYAMLIPREGHDLPFIITLLQGLLAFFVAAAGIRALLNPCRPAIHYLPLPESIANSLSRRTRILAFIVMTRWLVLELYTDHFFNETMYLLAINVVGIVWVLNVIWVFWLLHRLEVWRHRLTAPVLLSLSLVAGLIARAIGYINLGTLVITSITYSLVLVGLALVLAKVLADIFNGLDEGRYRWQKAMRRIIGLKDGDYVPGLSWLRLLVNLVLWFGTALLLLRVWDANEDFTADVMVYFTEGFQIAGLTIVPINLLGAILIFAVLLTFIGWIKGRLTTTWLSKTRMEPGAREALVTSFGYVGVAIAFIVALSFTGISFANITIVAGALSVGLGFGLQNIVNNFVSGIIMLVERPVRHGDWIVVGNTEGFVQHISIRTTTIRTFDRADVIVPNSDLISGQVTNWTLGNTFGRIKVQVGVAYGSNVETVIETLLEVAKKHPSVISGNPQLPDPYVLFLDFGDSSLDFELRAIIRDVNYRMHVISDLNRAINAAFNKLRIEIPFPQRDINFRAPLQPQGSTEVPTETSRAQAADIDAPDNVDMPDNGPPDAPDLPDDSTASKP